jgi:SAM-dependent methyltransferase
VAPEYYLAQIFTASPKIHYVPAGLNAPYIQVEMNLLQVPFQDDHFEVIICFHVLDQIVDDLRAMREMRRVLKPGGLAFIQSPIDDRRETTFEDPTCVTPEDRARVYGLSYQVRIYGLDYKDRLAAAGFSVRLDHFVNTLPPETITRYGLGGEGALYICTK